ncbi:nickel transporter permease [Paenibacillus luteus]|uniref:nickel transporter permease n=1 Tax=Paenibacillus luteus TaxID=2545753 RepID=UPI0011443705|nr:nickel transporter permease [Paenibacillus luteus]
MRRNKKEPAWINRNHLFNYPMLIVGSAIAIFFLILTLMGSWLAPNDSLLIQMQDRLLPPSYTYPLGTDHLGRCILSRLLEGAHTTLGLSLAVIAVVTVIGVPIGLLSGYIGGRVDAVLMRLADGSGALPEFLIAVAVAGILGPGLINVMLAVACVKWIGYARVVRGIVTSERQKEYIMASVVAGSSIGNVIGRHLLRQIASPLGILIAGDIGRTILLISALSYLGLGAQPPAPEWGAMLSDGRPYFQAASQLMIYPGLCILMVVLACNLISDGMRELLDVRGQSTINFRNGRKGET